MPLHWESLVFDLSFLEVELFKRVRRKRDKSSRTFVKWHYFIHVFLSAWKNIRGQWKASKAWWRLFLDPPWCTTNPKWRLVQGFYGFWQEMLLKLNLDALFRGIIFMLSRSCFVFSLISFSCKYFSCTSCYSLRKFQVLSRVAVSHGTTRRKLSDLAAPQADNEPKQYPEHIKRIVDDISKLTILEVSELNQLLKVNTLCTKISYTPPPWGSYCMVIYFWK